MYDPMTPDGDEVRRVIVNADDLGLSPGVNEGIVRAHRDGVVTSASLMVLRPAAAAALELVDRHPDLSVGLHLDLVEHQVRGGRWERTVARVDLEDRSAVEIEVQSQIRRFEELAGRAPTHLDSHQHSHLDPTAAPLIIRIAEERGIPLRGVTIPYRGDFYGQYGAGVPFPAGISPAAFVAAAVGSEAPLVEVACHPAAVIDIDDTYAQERVTELTVLCDISVALAIEMSGVELVNRSGRTRSRASGGPSAR